jgi:hypothetical protein
VSDGFQDNRSDGLLLEDLPDRVRGVERDELGRV